MPQFIVVPTANVTSSKITSLSGATVHQSTVIPATGTVTAFATADVSQAFTPAGLNATPGPEVITGAESVQFVIAPDANFDAGGALLSLANSFVSTSLNVTGLISGTPYRVVSLTGPSSPIVATTAPDAFTDNMWTVADTTTGGIVRLTISVMPYDGGSTITGVTVFVDGSPVSTGLTTPGTYDISSLTNNQSYSFTVAAVNSVGTATQSPAKTATPTASVFNLTPDATATTAAGVNAILASWSGANWATSVPAGKTVNDPRAIQATGVFASMTNSNYTFPQPVTIYAPGPYTYGASFPYRPTAGLMITGRLTAQNNTNLRYKFISAGDYTFTNNTGLWLDRCCFMSYAITTPGQSPTGTDVLGKRITGPNAVVRDCLWFGFENIQVGWKNGDNCLWEGNIFEHSNGDGLQPNNPAGPVSGITFRRNWFPRDFILGAGAHADCLQLFDIDSPNFTFWGNVGFQRHSPNSQNGFLFGSNGTELPGLNSQQNIVAMTGVNAMTGLSSVGGQALYNSLFRVNIGAIGSVQQYYVPRISAAIETRDYNFTHVNTAGNDSGQGANGIEIVIGTTDNGIPNFAGHLNYYNAVPTSDGFIDQFMPKAGTPTHWDYTGQKVGAWERSREIFVDKVVPGQVGWPVARIWHQNWDPLNVTGTSYTGVHDANGNNV